MAPVLRAPRKPVRHQVEEYPNIQTNEMHWQRDKNGNLRPTGFQRRRTEVKSPYPLRGDTSDLHTHPHKGPVKPNEREFHGPSAKDLRRFLTLAKTYGLKNRHISILDPKGKEMGRVTIHATPLLRQTPKATLTAIRKHFKDLGDQHLLHVLEHYGFIRLRFSPMPGYAYKNQEFKKSLAARLRHWWRRRKSQGKTGNSH